MRSARALCLSLVTLLGINSSPPQAAEVECIAQYDGHHIADDILRKLWPSGFRPAAGMCRIGYIHGTILSGDYEKVRTFYAKDQNLLNEFYIVSPGGNVNEAMKIGKLFRRYLITAWAPYQRSDGQFFLISIGSDKPLCTGGPECVCASACALIWFGAVNRNGIVGLHRPRIDDPQFKVLAPAEAAKIYRRTLDEIAKYLDEMEAPRSIINAMVATNSADIRWADADKDDLERPPSIAEWADAACGYITKEEKTAEAKLFHNQINGNLSSKEAILLNLLHEKDTRRGQCWLALRYARVEQLSPP